MEIVSIILALLGLMVLIVAHFWLVIVAFKKKAFWGLLTLLLPFWGSLVFCCLNFDRSKKPLLLYVIGFCFIPSSMLPILLFSPAKYRELTQFRLGETKAESDGAKTSDGASTLDEIKTSKRDK